MNISDKSALIMSNNISSLAVIRDAILAKSVQGNIQVLLYYKQSIQVQVQIEIIPQYDNRSSRELIKQIVNRYNLIDNNLRTEGVNQILRELVLQESESILPGTGLYCPFTYSLLLL